jgi:hypothetical protein
MWKSHGTGLHRALLLCALCRPAGTCAGKKIGVQTPPEGGIGVGLPLWRIHGCKRANVVHCCNGYFQELFTHTCGTHTRHVGRDAMKGSMKKREKSSFLCLYNVCIYLQNLTAIQKPIFVIEILFTILSWGVVI